MKLLNWVSIGFLCMCTLWTGTYASEDLSQKARQALTAGHTQKAADLLLQQVKESPRDYQAWFLLGVSQSKIQHYHPAIESFRRVIELRPDLAEPHNNLAVIYNELGDIPAAIRELEASLKKKPGYLIAEENIADLYIKIALSYYKKALQKTDDHGLKVRYGRLLQVRDPASLGENTSSASVETIKDKPVKTLLPSVASTSENTDSVTSNQASILESLSAIKKSVEAWRNAWQSQRLPDYFSAYADDYIPPSKFKDQAAWEAYKARVIGNKIFITVTLTNMKIALTDHQKYARVTFNQAFRSNSYNGDDKKVLVLKNLGGVWKIVSEKAR